MRGQAKTETGKSVALRITVCYTMPVTNRARPKSLSLKQKEED
jgi:hypothetical protein